MQPYEELSLLIESVEDDIARAVRSGNVALARQFAQELRARFSIYRDACADAGIAWAIRSQRTERSSRKRGLLPARGAIPPQRPISEGGTR